MKAVSICTCVLLTSVLAAGCGSGEGSPEFEPATTTAGSELPGAFASGTIGTNGGELVSVDGRLTITIPAGALQQDTEITIRQLSNKAHGGVGEAFRLGPEDTTFAIPATLTLEPDAMDLEHTSIEGLRVAFQNDEMYWELAGTPEIDQDAGTVTVTTTHMSDWSLVQGAVLIPMAAGVKTGESLSLSVHYCYPDQGSGDDVLAPLGYRCTDELAPLVPASEWSVNGIKGGNGTFGTVSGDGFSATFSAPQDVPSPDTVAVSVRIGSNTLLISNITIQEEAGDLNGTVEYTFTYLMAPGVTFKARADLALTMHDDGIDETNYDATGTLTMTDPEEFMLGDLTCVLQDAVKTVDDEYFFKVLKDPPSVRFGYNEQWMYHCTGQTEYDLAVVLFFFTGTGTACSEFNDVPISNIEAPQGRYTTSCAGTGEITAEWDFH